MKLAVIVNRFPTLSETFIVNKVLGLVEAKVDVTVWVQSTQSDAAAFQDRLHAQSPVKIKPVLTARGAAWVPLSLILVVLRNPLKAMQLLQQAVQLYAKPRQAARAWLMALPLAVEQYDVIHFELSGLAVTYLNALPLLRPARLVTSCRGAAEQITPLLRPERGPQLGRVFAQMDAVHCVSTDIQRTAERYGLRPEQAFINHPAIDPQAFQRRQPYPLKAQGPYRLLTVGRLHWKKGLEFGLLAVRMLVDRGLDVEYHLIGGGEEEEKLRFMIDDLALGERVKLLGRLPGDQVRQALEEADIFLLPSLSEGLSNAALEAMAMEVPVVSTRAGGMAEAITDGIDGLLTNTLDFNDMANKMTMLLSEPNLRIVIGKTGRLRVLRDFSQFRQTITFMKLYQTIQQK